LTKEELIKKVAEKSGFPENEVGEVVDAFTEQIKAQLAKGEKIKIDDFGSFVLSKNSDKTA
jgi:nucleoid DNA-binding protein